MLSSLNVPLSLPASRSGAGVGAGFGVFVSIVTVRVFDRIETLPAGSVRRA